MTLLVILVLVAVVAAGLLIWSDVRRKRKAKRTTAVTPHERITRYMEHERYADNAGTGVNSRSGLAELADRPIPNHAPIERASEPVPIERVERMSPGRIRGGEVVDGGPPQKRSKPRATKQTVHEVLRHHGPATAKEVAAMLRDTTPSKVATILVALRRDGKASSEQKRNLKVWTSK